MNCKNCNNELLGKFCNQCGQKSKVERIDLNYLLNEIPNSIFQLNRGFFFTLKELFLRPGHSIREFLSGKRVNHYKPISYLLITSTIYVLSAYLMERNTFFYDMALGFEEGASGANNNDETIETSFLSWMSKYQAYIPLIILPLFSISTYLAFIKSEYNYLEHLVINFYITGQQMIIYWLLGFLFYKENIFMVTPIAIGIIYNFWCFNQIFKDKKTSTKAGLVILSYIIFVIGMIVTSFIYFGVPKILN